MPAPANMNPFTKPGRLIPALAIAMAVALIQAAAGQERPEAKAKMTSTKMTSIMDASRTPGIDTAHIRELYMDGDFDPAGEILEAELKSDLTLDHADSVFIYKHLGVMYAARYETRERGKMYMHQLLMVEPTAKIMDMYASDMIYMIFKNIQDEFETNRAKLARAQNLVDGNGNPGPDSTDRPSPNPGSRRTLAIWIGAAAIGLGVGAYFLIAALSDGGSSTHSF